MGLLGAAPPLFLLPRPETFPPLSSLRLCSSHNNNMHYTQTLRRRDLSLPLTGDYQLLDRCSLGTKYFTLLRRRSQLEPDTQ